MSKDLDASAAKMLHWGYTKVIVAKAGCPLKSRPHVCANCEGEDDGMV